MSKCASQCSKSIQTPLPPTFLHLLHLFHLSKPDELYDLHLKGPSIKYVTLFLANFYPPSSPRHTSSHIPGPPESTSHISDPRFLEGLVQKNGQKPLVQILSQLFAGVFVRGSFVWKVLFGVVFVRSRSVRIHLLHQKVKHHFKFHVSYIC